MTGAPAPGLADRADSTAGAGGPHPVHGWSIERILTRDALASHDPVISVHVDDVDGAYRGAERRGYEIVLPLRTEAWGVRRFFVRARTATRNLVQHRD